jgi:hypothetical protein
MSIDRSDPRDGAAGAAPARSAEDRAGAHVGVAQRVVAVHADHEAAKQTVQELADRGFPAHRATIVGRGLTLVDRVKGQLSTADVAARGAVSGLVVGALVGSLLGLFDLVTPTVPVAWLAVNAAILGAVLGAVTALLGYAFTHGSRSFVMRSGITASHYDVQVDADLADRAVRLLDGE